jgi:hypothetical protein
VGTFDSRHLPIGENQRIRYRPSEITAPILSMPALVPLMIDMRPLEEPLASDRLQFLIDCLNTPTNILTPSDCLSCKYFSGNQLLKCAVNPARMMDDDCAEFEGKNA